eukprot:188929-Prymnesium_polylepis.1
MEDLEGARCPVESALPMRRQDWPRTVRRQRRPSNERRRTMRGAASAHVARQRLSTAESARTTAR